MFQPDWSQEKKVACVVPIEKYSLTLLEEMRVCELTQLSSVEKNILGTVLSDIHSIQRLTEKEWSALLRMKKYQTVLNCHFGFLCHEQVELFPSLRKKELLAA